MASPIEEALAEINAELARIAPQLEGLRDYARLNIHPESMVEVQSAITVYERRETLLHAAKAALEELLGDGHPAIPVREVPQGVFVDLRENQATIQAAFKVFATVSAATLGLSASDPEPKS